MPRKNEYIIDNPGASPSIPSKKFIALVIPTTQRIVIKEFNRKPIPSFLKIITETPEAIKIMDAKICVISLLNTETPLISLIRPTKNIMDEPANTPDIALSGGNSMKNTRNAMYIPIPPPIGVGSSWIFLSLGISIMLNLLLSLITIGVNVNDIAKGRIKVCIIVIKVLFIKTGTFG